MQKETTKAKKRITDLTFDHDGAHLALCSKSQGAANNWNKALIMKGHNFSPEIIQKMQAVQVTMSIPDFLKKFFWLMEEDAKFLASIMGYVEPPEDESQEAVDDYNEWVKDNFESFSIIKSLHESKNLPESLSKLTGEQYLSVLNDQSLIEKALKEFADGSKPEANTSATNVEKTKVEASASKVTKTKKEKNMTQATAPEMVEKAVLTVLEKAMDEQKVQLQKALDMVKAFEDEKKQAVIKSKTDAVTALVKDAKQAEVLVKAALALDKQEDFEALVGVVKALVEQVDKSDLFKEVGASASADESKQEESKLAQVIKSKYPKQ